MSSRVFRWVISPLVFFVVAASCGSTADRGNGRSELGSESVVQAAEGLPVDHRQLALIADVHGPTSDVSAEMARLAPFPELPSPVGARIIELDVLAPRPGKVGRLRVETNFLADGGPDDLVLFYETSFAATGWELIEQRRGQTIHGLASTDFSYEQPSSDDGPMPDELEVSVIDDTDLGHTRINVIYKVAEFTADKARYPINSVAVIQPWFSDWVDVPLPTGWEAASATSVTSFFGEGRSTISLARLLSYANAPFNTVDEFQQLVLDEAERAGLTARVTQKLTFEDGVEVEHPDFEVLNLVLDDRFDATVRVVGRARFTTPPFDPVSSEGAEQSTDPLPLDASITNIETVMNDMHGPSTDVSAQLRRLGPFPDLPTPKGASIIRLEAGVIPPNQSRFDRLARVVDPEGLAAQVAGVRLVVNGTIDDVETFYLTAIQGRQWTTVRQQQETEDDERSNRRRYEYDIVDAGDGNEAQFSLEIDDDIDSARVVVRLEYVEFVPFEESGIERFASWIGNAPIPDGGLLDHATIYTEEISDSINLRVSHAFEGNTNEELYDAIGLAIGDSDYTLNPELDATPSSYPLVFPGADRAGVGLDATSYVGDLAEQVSPEIRDRIGVRVTATLPLSPGAEPSTTPDDNNNSATDGSKERTTADVTDGLSPLAPLGELRATLIDVHGQTDDVSGEVLRIARFPDIATPIDASIIGLDASVSILDRPDPDEGVTIHYTTVALDVNGPGVDVEQVTTFYRAQIKSRSWELKADETINVDGGVRTSFEYDRADQEPTSDLPILTVTVTDDPNTLERRFGDIEELDPGVIVVISYRESFPTDQVAVDRLLGWPGNAPLPEGATVDGLSVATTNRSGLRGSFFISLEYPETSQAAVLSATLERVPDSDYQLAEDGNPDERAISFTHPWFSSVELAVFEKGDGASARFQAFLPLPQG